MYIGGVMFLLGTIGPTELILLVIILFPLFAWVIALIDIVRSEFTESNKIVWVLVVIFLPVIGAVLYFLMGRQQKTNPTQ